MTRENKKEKKIAPDKWEFMFIVQINDQIPLYVKH